MKPNHKQLIQAVATMAEVIPFFPKTDAGMEIVAQSMASYVNTVAELAWLRDTAMTYMREFGVVELRGIFCRRFKPADGVEMEAKETAGFTTADAERCLITREGEEFFKKLAEWKQEQKLLAGTVEKPAESTPDPVVTTEEPAAAARKPPQRKRDRITLREAEEKLNEAVKKVPKRTEEETARLLAELESRLRKPEKE